MNESRDDRCGERARLASTAGYASDAERLASQYESVTFDRVHGAVLPYLDVAPCRAADIGAGTGRDAAALSARGHRVTAVEPVAELRAIGQRLHQDAGISWLDDALPDLLELEGPFGLVLITAVWMHLDAEERGRGVRRVAGLVSDGGRLVLKLRHGPVPAGRRMFDVTPEEVIDGAAGLGLELLHREHRADLHGRDGVTWTSLAFERPCPALSFAARVRAGSPAARPPIPGGPVPPRRHHDPRAYHMRDQPPRSCRSGLTLVLNWRRAPGPRALGRRAQGAADEGGDRAERDAERKRRAQPDCLTQGALLRPLATISARPGARALRGAE